MSSKSNLPSTAVKSSSSLTDFSAESGQIDRTNVDGNSEGNFIHSVSPTRVFAQVTNTSGESGTGGEDGVSRLDQSNTSQFEFNYTGSIDKNANQSFYAQHSIPDFDSAGHLLSLTKRHSSATDYLLHHPPFLASVDSRPHPSFESHYLPTTSFVDAPVISSAQSSKVSLGIGLDAMAPLRYNQSNLFNQSTIPSEESKLIIADQQPDSSSPPLLSPHLSSSSFSSHYQLPYNSFSRMYDMSGKPWKSMYRPPSTVLTAEPQHLHQSYLNPPPAHHNTTAGRFLASSNAMVASSSYLSPSLSTSESHSGPTTNDTILTRKYTRSANRPNQTTKNSEDYKLKRERNNIAVRKSREKAKRRLKDNECRAQDLIDENEVLRNRVKFLSKALHGLRVYLSTFGVSQEKINFEVTKSLSEEDTPNINSIANLVDPSALIKSSSSSDYCNSGAPASSSSHNNNYRIQ